MATVEKRLRNGRNRWYVRYRDPSGRQRTKTFDRRVDAERYLTTVESSKLTGSYVDPARGRVTVGEWADQWLHGQAHLKPSTRERYAGIVRKHIRPRWGSTRLVDVAHADVQAWVINVGRASEPATVRKVHRVLSFNHGLRNPGRPAAAQSRRGHQPPASPTTRAALLDARAGACSCAGCCGTDRAEPTPPARRA